MTSRFASKLTYLDFSLPAWLERPTEELVREYERRFAVVLPSDYRHFLVHHGGLVGNATCAFQEPTPCGKATSVDEFYGFTPDARRLDVARATELIAGAPDVVAIGQNLIGAMFWLKCSGPDCGHVYMHDHEGRSAWPDELFQARYPRLGAEINAYLTMRGHGALPKKPPGYEHVYRLATSFEEFIERLER